MNETFDVSTILLLALAVIIFLRLRSVLGRRTGHERPPYIPESNDTKRSESDLSSDHGQDNIVTLPRHSQSDRQTAPTVEDVAERIKGYAPKGSLLEENLTEIVIKDPNFSPSDFIKGAKTAYEMIVMAFSEGDRKVLKPLLSAEVYEGFSQEISARENRDEVIESKFVGIDKAEILEASIKDSEISLTVKFVSEIIKAVKDAAGEVIEGDPKKIIEVMDIWTFSRQLTSRDPNWKLIGTESAN